MWPPLGLLLLPKTLLCYHDASFDIVIPHCDLTLPLLWHHSCLSGHYNDSDVTRQWHTITWHSSIVMSYCPTVTSRCPVVTSQLLITTPLWLQCDFTLLPLWHHSPLLWHHNHPLWCHKSLLLSANALLWHRRASLEHHSPDCDVTMATVWHHSHDLWHPTGTLWHQDEASLSHQVDTS